MVAKPYDFNNDPTVVVGAAKYMFGFQAGASMIIGRARGIAVKTIWAAEQKSSFAFICRPNSLLGRVGAGTGEGTEVRHPEEYAVVGRVALAIEGHAAYCDHCKNPVFDQAVYGRDPVLRRRAKRGWVVLTDARYVVRGPDGQRHVCRPCVERCGFRWHEEDEGLFSAED